VADGYVVHNCDVETFQQIALNPETRVMTKIVLTDEGYATLKSIMGDSVESRRTLLGVE
jgi:DNA gyrase/topoisomerase IV subunit B